jgi:hypothetical protein
MHTRARGFAARALRFLEERMTEQNAATAAAGDTFAFSPTVLVRLDGDAVEVVTAGGGADEALIVFRGFGDARAFQAGNPRYSGAEGFLAIGMEREAVAAVLGKHGLGWVHMPEAWTGEKGAGVDSFTAANFLGLLEASETPA